MSRVQSQTSAAVAEQSDRRVLLLAPTVRDGEVTRSILLKAGLHCVVLRNLYEVSSEIAAGAGALLMTEDVFAAAGGGELLSALDSQPAWSELPVIMMMRGAGDSPAAQRMMASFHNVTLLERPAPMRSLVSATLAAIRGRQRQYQIRDQMDAVRRAEERARELQQQLELAIEASELGTFHCELKSGKIFWNARCKAHFWLPPEHDDIGFELFYSLLHPEDRERTRLAVEASLTGGENYDIEYRTVSPGGNIRWVRATGRTYRDWMDRPDRFDGTTRDITLEKLGAEERRLLLERERAARQEAERVSSVKDEFLATLSHELRTPLNAIFGWTQLLRSGKDDPATLDHALGVIDRNVRLQTQLIEDLLDMSRIISGKVRLELQKVDLTEVVEAALESVKPAAQARNIRLERFIDTGAGPVSGDPGRIQQILWNLLANAIKFTDKDGRVQVHVERVNSDVEIRISDNGQGMSADFLPNLFSRFSQADSSTRRKHGGLGIGLSIVKSLVEMHGGTVRATSAGEGQGSTFIVRLPLRAVQANVVETSENRSSPGTEPVPFDVSKLRGLKVLVVDDEPDARELIKRFLVVYQAVPILADSADEALRLIGMFQPDVIVSDIGMPLRDGYALMRDVRGQDIRTPAIALTAFARNEDRGRAIRAGYQTHLSKPFEPLELLAVVAGLSNR